MARRKRARKSPSLAAHSGPSLPPDAVSRRDPAWAWGLGLLFAVALLKWGGAIVLDDLVRTPSHPWEWIVGPWPFSHLLPVLFIGTALVAWKTWGKLRLGLIPILLLTWWAWLTLATLGSEDRHLSALVWSHVTCAVGAWFLGALVLARISRHRGFWIPVLVAFSIILGSAFQQHYGGKDAMRAFVERHQQTGWRDVPSAEIHDLVDSGALIPLPEGGFELHPEYRKRLESDRVFGTMGGYPNALAGVVLLLAPALALVLWRRTSVTGHQGTLIALGIVLYGSLASLFWSGSKTGWLVGLGLCGVFLLRQPLPRRLRISLVIGAAVLGLAGFGWKYSAYFQKGATSLGARWDYWRAAGQTAMEHPLTGTGPGTFARAYERIKPPEAEMARLAHNDLLQQASDSGWPALLLFAAWLGGNLAQGWRRLERDPTSVKFGLWLGCLGWALQGLMDYVLYIPALAWPAFLFLGWLTGPGNRAGNPHPAQS